MPPPLKILDVHAQGRDDGWEGGPVVWVEVKLEHGIGPVDPIKYGSIWPVILPKLHEMGETRFPSINFVRAERDDNAVA